jgi:flagellar biogenesis protein FliO
MRATGLALAAILLTVAPAASADPAPAPSWLAPALPAPSVGQPDAPRGGWRSLLAIVAVGVLGGAAYYMKRKRRALAGGGDAPRLSIVEAVRVGPKGQIVLANVQGRLLLLGVTDSAIRRIAWCGRAPERAPKETEHDRDRVTGRARAPGPPRGPPTSPPPPSRAGDKHPLRAVGSVRPFQSMLEALRNADDPLVRAADETQDVVERRTRPPLRSIEQIVKPLEGQVSGLKTRRPPPRKP